MIESLVLSLTAIFLLIMISPTIAEKIRLPVIVTELIFGIILGKSLLDIVPSSSVMDFLAHFGLIYLMFLVGLEVRFEKLRQHFPKIAILSSFSFIVPFLTGFLLSPHVNVHPLLLGTIFSTTSLGIILPLTKEINCSEEFSHILLASVAIVDVISIFMLAFALSLIEGSIGAYFAYSFLAILSLFLIPLTLRMFKGSQVQVKMEQWILEKTHFESGVRATFALIVLLVAVSGQLGFHAIIGAFIAGLIIAELIPKASLLEEKLASFGYGFFTPLFFILMGAKVDIPTLISNITNINHLTLIVTSGILSKIIGVSIASLIAGFKAKESITLGLLHSARVSLIIAAAEISHELGLIDINMFSTLVILAIISSTLGPTIGKHIIRPKPDKI